MAHPDPAQGAVVRRHEPRIGERWTRGSVVHERREQGGLNPVRSRLRADERRSMRTAKSRGPGCRCYSQALRRRGERDRATRAVNLRGDGGKQELVSGEIAPYAVRPSRREGRTFFGFTCLSVVHLRVHFIARRTAGASRRPAFPAPFL